MVDLTVDTEQLLFSSGRVQRAWESFTDFVRVAEDQELERMLEIRRKAAKVYPPDSLSAASIIIRWQTERIEAEQLFRELGV